jgi:hypothetical protein
VAGPADPATVGGSLGAGLADPGIGAAVATAAPPTATEPTTAPDTPTTGGLTTAQLAAILAQGDPTLAAQIEPLLEQGPYGAQMPTDPTKFAQLTALLNAPANPLVAAATSAYFDIWGTPPPNGDYIQNLIDQGLNLFEIQQHEMDKPGFALTSTYRDRYSGYAQVAANVFGRR